MNSHNRDVIGDKCVRNDAGELTSSDAQKTNAWVEHQKAIIGLVRLFFFASPILGPSLSVKLSQVSGAIKKMKCHKTAGLSGIVAVMLKASGFVGLEVLSPDVQFPGKNLKNCCPY